MNILFNKNILLGITGSIAAYKAADITSKLKKEGCNIKIVMTKSSESFVTETTLESLSSNPVFTEEDKDVGTIKDWKIYDEDSMPYMYCQDCTAEIDGRYL